MNAIAQTIQDQIESGVYQRGEVLPSIEQLQVHYTAREEELRVALAELIYEGFLERGSNDRSKIRVAQRLRWGAISGNHSITREARRRGQEPGVQILAFETVPSWPIVRKRLQLAPEAEVIIIERLRLADDMPVSLEYSYYPADLYPGMTIEMFTAGGEKQSSFKIMQEKYNLVPHTAVDEVTVVAVEEREAKLLNLDPSTPVLLRFRVTLSDKGIPIKGSRAIYLFKAGYELPI